jgi:hypothetical protein
VRQIFERELARDTIHPALLSYLLKHDPRRGVALANELLDKDDGLLGEFASERLSPALEQLALARLDSPGGETARNAVYIVGQFPSDANRRALKDRLRRWHDEQVRIKNEKGAFHPRIEHYPFDFYIMDALCNNDQRIVTPSEVRELEPWCVTEQARNLARYCDRDWESPLRIRFYPVHDSEFEHLQWPTAGSNGPMVDTDAWLVAHYLAKSPAELKALLARFPRGTAFALPRVSTDADEFARFFNDLRQHAEQHGMKLIVADP